jgi:hypothetical protein
MRFSVCSSYNYLEYNALRRLLEKIRRFQRRPPSFSSYLNPDGRGLECFPGAVMGIEVRVRLIDLKRAFRRLIARLPDESAAGVDFIVFSASGNSLDIAVGGTSEVLNASVVHPGQARVPCPVFRGIARSLRFHHGRVIMLALWPRALTIDRTEYRHPSIIITASARGKQSLRTKPAKLQNL